MSSGASSVSGTARRRRSQRSLARRAVLATGGACLLGVVAVSLFAGSPGRLAEGTTVAGLDVGGLGTAAARARLEARSDALAHQPVAFVAGGRTFELTPSQLGVRPAPELVQKLLVGAFGWMFAGLLLSAGVAYLVGSSFELYHRVTSLWLPILIGQFVLALLIQGAINKLSPTLSLGLFFVFCATMGLTIGAVVAPHRVCGSKCASDRCSRVCPDSPGTPSNGL